MTESQENQTPAPKNIAGPTTMGCGCLVMIAPILMAAMATAPGHNMFSEGDAQSGGTYIWGMFFSVPLGLTVVVTGAVIAGIRAARNRKARLANTSADITEQSPSSPETASDDGNPPTT